MNTNKNSRKNGRIRTSLRSMWQDQVAANRAMLQLRPYFDEHRDDGR
jgi:hypothetical protein